MIDPLDDIAPTIAEVWAESITSLRSTAAALNGRSIPTPPARHVVRDARVVDD
jgi:hypothetical protein